MHTRSYLAFARDQVKAGRPEALTWAVRGLEIAERFELPELVVRAMSARGVARFDSGDPGGVDEIRRALQRGQELGLGSDTAGAYVNLAYATHLFAGARAMLEVVTEGIEFCDRRGLTFHAMWMRNGAAGARLDIGDWDGALGVTQEIAAWERAAGESYINVTAMTQMGVILVERGAVEEARPVVEQLLERSRRAEDPQVLVPALIVAAALAAARGRPSEAAMLLRDADAAQPGGWERVPWLAMAVRTATSIGENELAVRMIEVSEKTDIAHAGLLASARGSVAEAVGDLEEAASQYEAAVAAWAERDVEHERAHALFGQGRCLMTLGRTAEAAVSLEAARDIFQAVGAESQVREISILLAPFEVRAS